MLVVDDTASIRTEIRLLLEDAGLAVVGEADHGAEGVMLARELRPDVVVMDVRMPILDGIAATRYVTRELPGTKVIVFSAFDDPELAEGARAAGAAGFLTKGDLSGGDRGRRPGRHCLTLGPAADAPPSAAEARLARRDSTSLLRR